MQEPKTQYNSEEQTQNYETDVLTFEGEELNPAVEAEVEATATEVESAYQEPVKPKLYPAYTSKKITIITVIATVVLLLLGLAVYIFGPWVNTPKSIKGELAYIEGSVLSLGTDGKWTAAKVGQTLEQGAAIKVGNDGRAIINLDDGSAIRLNSGSTATLTTLEALHVVITNNSGEIYTRVTKSARVFDVLVDGVTYRAMGTAFKTMCLLDSSAPTTTDTAATTQEKGKTILNGVEVYESKVQIIGVNSANETLVNQGERYFMVDAEQPDQERKISTVTGEDILKDEFLMWNKDWDSKSSEFKSQMGILDSGNAPTLNLTSPVDGDKTTTALIIVAGTVDKNSKVTINGSLTKNNNGTFSSEFTLEPGKNTIDVIAEDAQGNKTVKSITVTLDALTSPSAAVTGSPVPTSGNSITLNGAKTTDGIALTWTVQGITIQNGFKVLKADHANPSYPGDDNQLISSNSSRSYSWALKDGATYHFRVCQYDGNGTCLSYSNDVTVTAPTPTAISNPATALTLNVSGPASVHWVVTGVASQGFKIVWSKTSGPTYPLRDSHDKYYHATESGARDYAGIDAFDGNGTYYVRVCAFANGADGSCTPYSNEVELIFATPVPTNSPVPTVTPSLAPSI